ncbi:MAG TPA: hypothetical protein VLA67_04685 [Nitrospiraceae bacterium]|nr:hypothetical protein [Nitrospiraceae bacterium]
MRRPPLPPRFLAAVLLLSVPILLLACAETSVDRTSWIQIGKTTKSEVVAHYGEPDLVFNDRDGETVTYRPARQPSPSIEVPTAQAGPFGTTRTQTQTIEPGLGKDKSSPRPQKEIRIRYDAQGVVQDVMR